MELIQHIRKTDLARQTRQIINAVQRGQTAIVEAHGQPEVAILDIVDYWLMRAVLYHYTHPQIVTYDEPLQEAKLSDLSDMQSRYNLVISHYLAGGISLARSAELLGLSSFELRTKAMKLEIPLRLGPATLEETAEEINTAVAWEL